MDGGTSKVTGACVRNVQINVMFMLLVVIIVVLVDAVVVVPDNNCGSGDGDGNISRFCSVVSNFYLSTH